MIFAIAGLSGAGKTTVAKKITELFDIDFTLSYTTRPMRNTEKQDVDYHFITNKQYDNMTKNNELIAKESFKTDFGVWKYGFKKKELLKNPLSIAVINPNGINDLKKDGLPIISICIEVDENERAERLNKRNDNQPKKEIKRRTAKDFEMFKNYNFDYRVENDDFDKCVNEIAKIIISNINKEQREKVNKFVANQIKRV